MRATLRAIAIVLTVLMFLWAAVGSVRWAKRSSVAGQLMASAMILAMGMIGAPVVDPPQQGIEEAREDKGTKGAQSGDPPTA